MEQFSKVESIVNEDNCVECKKEKKAKVNNLIVCPPKILVLRVKRFDYEKGGKRMKNSDIEIENDLSLIDICVEEEKMDTKADYKLKAMITSVSDTIQSGHYEAYLKD